MVAAASAIATACYGPTQIMILLSTDANCAEMGGVSVAVGELGPTLETADPAAVSHDCDGGDLGTLAIIPSGAIGDAVGIRVVAGFGQPLEKCTAPFGPGCIVARRTLRYIPHTQLYLPIRLSVSCAGVTCDPNDTCINGACAPAQVPDASACVTPTACADDGGPPVAFDSDCGDMSGAELGSPWPMTGVCPRHIGRSPFFGPATTPTKRWTVATQNAVISTPIVTADGTVFFGSNDGSAYAVDLASGNLKWKSSFGGTVGGNPGVGADGTLVIGSSFGTAGIDPLAPTTPRWTGSGTGDVTLGPGEVVYVGGGMSLFALDGPTGKISWQTQLTTSNQNFSAPAIGPDGTLYVGCTDANIYAVDPTTHAVRWMYAAIGEAVPLVAPNGTIFAASTNGASSTVAALDPTSGKELWNSNGGVSSDCLAMEKDGTIVVGLETGLEGLDPATGNQRWIYKGGGVTSCPILDAAGRVYAITGTGDVFAVDTANPSAALWTFPFPTATDLSMAADGTLLVDSSSGVVMAIR